MSRKEKRILAILGMFLFILPILMVEKPLEIISLVLPLYFWYPGISGTWFYTGKSFWQVFLACYGAGSTGIILTYSGVSLIKLCYKKTRLKKQLLIPLFHPQKVDSQKRELARWLNGKSVWAILLVFFAPLPWSDFIATVAMQLKGIKNGIWLLLIVNIPHVLLIVWMVQSGFKLFV